MEETVRPATTSVYGDTGLWFVPTGEVLRDRTWSASGYRVNWDVRQGFTDISHFEGTFAYGVKSRAEIFGAVRFDTRIDRDTRPIFGFGGDRTAASTTTIPSCAKDGSATTSATRSSARRSTCYRNRAKPRSPLPFAAWSSCRRVRRQRIRNGQDGRAIRLHRQQGDCEHCRDSGSIGYVHRGDPDEYDLSTAFPSASARSSPRAAR